MFSSKSSPYPLFHLYCSKTRVVEGFLVIGGNRNLEKERIAQYVDDDDMRERRKSYHQRGNAIDSCSWRNQLRIWNYNRKEGITMLQKRYE